MNWLPDIWLSHRTTDDFEWNNWIFAYLEIPNKISNFLQKKNKAEDAVQSYAAGVGGLGLYLQYADQMT